MPRMFPSFPELIAPHSLEEFASRFWEKEVLHSTGSYPIPFGMKDVDAYLARSDLRIPAIRLVQDGKNVSPKLFTSELTLGSHKSADLIDTDSVIRLFQRGATILFQMAHTSFPPLQKWCASLEQFWGFPVEMNVYLTPPNSQGFTSHYDTHSVFALQVFGSKTWEIYDGNVALPFLDEPFSESNVNHSSPRRVIGTIELENNDLLYIPRGHFHSAKACQTPSLHITVGFFPPTRLGILTRWINTLKNEKFFRESPIFGLKPFLTDEWLESEPESIVEAMKPRLPIDIKFFSEKRHSTVEVQPKENRLLDLLNLEKITADSLLVRRDNLYIKRIEEQDRTGLILFNTKVMFPRHAKVALDDLLSRAGQFRPMDLVCNYSNESKVVLCRRLIVEGLLSFAAK
jgi:ribosomal protein L16 Arg81 hydroxylase